MNLEDRIKRLEYIVLNNIVDHDQCECCENYPKDLDEMILMDETDLCNDCNDAKNEGET